MDFCVPSALSSTTKSDIPTVGTSSTVDAEVANFLKQNPNLHLGGQDDFTFSAGRSPHGTIQIRRFYPKSGHDLRKKNESAALIYFHGGGYTVGSVDEFENGLRIVAEESGAVIIGVEYRLAPEWSFPVQLDEYDAVICWFKGNEGKKRGISSEKICGGGDSAGGNMTAAVTLRRKDNGKKPLKAQLLFHRYISPGMQKPENLKDPPPAAVFTCVFDPLRDVGVEYAHLLQEAENTVHWSHFDSLTHGFLQFAPWSEEAMKATKLVGVELKSLTENQVFGYPIPPQTS
ncbi:Alpha/Beta hydrolase protein [Fusarium redolens]|uniref:Alpha/Beta hydrolase protein n=1 Tax=Fusarium redolens TaxID=48865 RepID=A0A9P9GBD5_FUSRE|nr:Alpha/Beta hydrolase protein [Fusarium redolens]KAH7234834.1 Alpha/Beta hydrolase protein [Fusarium redolens]